MRLLLVGFALWLISSAFLVLFVGSMLWLSRKFSSLRDADGLEWSRLTAFGLLAPPSLGIVLAIAGLSSAISCPATSVRNYHLCLHLAKHLCGHASATAIGKSHSLLLAALVWLGLTGATTVVLSRRAKLVKRFRPSPKLKRAIALAQLPPNLPVWESDNEVPAGLVGVLSPSIFVSRETVQRLPLSALTTVLRHEYAHFARKEHWLRWLLFVVALIFAPVPFAVWLQREWRCACERAADDFAAPDSKSARSLADALSAVQNFVGLSDGQLRHRIERLKAKRTNSKHAILFGVGAILAGLVLGVLAFSLPSIWLTFHCLAEALILR
jgi:Zn-dependent protease with chaperone function